MRRIALLGLILLAGCDYVGNPGAGFGGFISDTVSLRTNPNEPVGDAPNMQRVMGRPTDAAPLLPEPGNVWPGPLPPAKTLSDLQREAGAPIDTGAMPGTSPRMAGPRPIPATLTPPAHGRVLTTPGGPATTTVGANGVETYTLPDGKQGIVMPNANGSLTLIGSDGSTITVPAPAR
ncbi:MAG: hypothetical protein BGP12_21230 [Rhodospirillales bacterium 70-18]|nr:hypothetical protein [Rhodospirillales bacterium]OJY70278.1 MAG: hypothetical protein BGP12_21230 [Rhodospirillales bacterium 70-18]